MTQTHFWPSFGPGHKLEDVELDALVRYWANIRLTLAYRQYAVGVPGLEGEDDTRLRAGQRIALIATLLDKDRVETVVKKVEHKFSKHIHLNPDSWKRFENSIMVESYEGRYLGEDRPF